MRPVNATAFKNLLLDLDGTLADTAPDLVAALNAVLTRHNRPTVDTCAARYWAGGGSISLIEHGFGISRGSSGFHTLRQQLLEHYGQHLCEHTQLFPGMGQLLRKLESAGRTWGIVTNKPARFTRPLLVSLGLSHRAAVVVCGDSLATTKPHSEPVIHACHLANISITTTLLAGDDPKDIKAGRAAGTRTAAVTWGYAAPGDNPSDWGADNIVNSPFELEKLLSLS